MLERNAINLQVEEAALKKEKDTLSQQRLEEVRKELGGIQDKLTPLLAAYNKYVGGCGCGCLGAYNKRKILCLCVCVWGACRKCMCVCVCYSLHPQHIIIITTSPAQLPPPPHTTHHHHTHHTQRKSSVG